MAKLARTLLSTLLFICVSAIALLVAYPEWDAVQYQQAIGIVDSIEGYKTTARIDYFNMEILILLFGFLLPLIATNALRKKHPYAATVFVGIFSFAFLNGLFFYGGVYCYDRPLFGLFQFRGVMFLQEFQFLGLIGISPVIAAAAWVCGWLMTTENRPKTHPPTTLELSN